MSTLKSSAGCESISTKEYKSLCVELHLLANALLIKLCWMNKCSICLADSHFTVYSGVDCALCT
jgi:hypothetical protein